MYVIKNNFLVENLNISSFSESAAKEIRAALDNPEATVINTHDQVHYLVTEARSQKAAQDLINKEYAPHEHLKLHWDPILNMYIIQGDCLFEQGISAVCVAVYKAYCNLKVVFKQLKYLETLGYVIETKKPEQS
ncbi:MAG: hypothetical protein PHH85_02240 [Candidatus Methanoperedens sp.]|nr:hypothetical protein [Candidatus Methanoperedens sp.]